MYIAITIIIIIVASVEHAASSVLGLIMACWVEWQKVTSTSYQNKDCCGRKYSKINTSIGQSSRSLVRAKKEPPKRIFLLIFCFVDIRLPIFLDKQGRKATDGWVFLFVFPLPASGRRPVSFSYRCCSCKPCGRSERRWPTLERITVPKWLCTPCSCSWRTWSWSRKREFSHLTLTLFPRHDGVRSCCG